jgi:hypothetical protein
MIERAQLESILNRVQQWVLAADTKVSVLAATEAAVFAYVLPALAEWLEDASTTTVIRAGLFVAILLLAYGIYRSLDALLPRTRNPHRLKSVTFFGDIATLTPDAYRARLKEMTNDDWEADYVNQIHTNAVIASGKHHSVRVGVVSFGIGLTVLAACYVAARAGF